MFLPPPLLKFYTLKPLWIESRHGFFPVSHDETQPITGGSQPFTAHNSMIYANRDNR